MAQSLSLWVGCAMGVAGWGEYQGGIRLGVVSPFTRTGLTDQKGKKQAEHVQSLQGSKISRHGADNSRHQGPKM